jgi:broad specificity phosphatase PhoE
MPTKEIERPACIVLVRSGDSNATQLPRGQGVRDKEMRGQRSTEVELTEHGISQAKLAGAHLAGNLQPFDAIFVSPWRRATHTLELILDAYPESKRMRMLEETRQDERLRDRDPGIIAFLDHLDIRRRFPEEARRLELEGPYYYRPAGGESWADVTLRSYSIINTMFRDRVDQRILVVTHGLVILSFRKILERLSHDQILSVIDYDLPLTCSISRFEPLPGHAEAGRMQRIEWNTVPYGAEFDAEVVGLEQYAAVKDWRLHLA